MVEERKERLPHLLVKETASTHRYTRPQGGSGGKLHTPFRTRTQHAEFLLSGQQPNR